MAAKASTRNSLEKWYVMFGEWGMTAGEAVVLLMVDGFDLN